MSSYSDRPPPMVPYMAPPAISQGPPPSGRSFRPGASTIGRPQMYPRPSTPPPTSEGPTITVFVGNISERASEPMIKRILSCVGYVLNWKRVSTFGFCDYDGPLAGSRAVRLLHELEVDGKRLVAKVDAKNKQLLDNFQQEEEDRSGGARDGASEQRDDDSVLARISHILDEYREDMESFQQAGEKEQSSGKQAKVLKDTDLEDDKRDLIHREIGKFRKFAEEEEQKKEKEKDRRKREEVKTSERDKNRRSPSPPPPRREVPERKKERRRSRSTDRYEREREEREQRERERELRDRERDRERERERDRAREDVASHKNVRDVQRTKEVEDEMRERKKLEKKARDKEAAYQERLRNWELRERRKAKEYERDSERDRCREEDREREAKRLKEFLEDYEDDRDDPKYYKGKELQRRLSDRLREADADAKDRAREQEELEELKTKIFTGEYVDPTEEFERQKRERENLYKPRLLIDMNLEASQQRDAELNREREREAERIRAKERERQQKEQYVMAQASRELAAVDAEPIDSDSSNDAGGGGGHDDHYMDHGDDDYGRRDDMEVDGGTPGSPPSQQPPAMNTAMISLNLGAAHAKKKRLEVKDVFSIDDESEEAAGPKKRKLVPLDYEDKHGKGQQGVNGTSAPATAQKRSSEDIAKSQEERRRHIKSIIDKIPTEKADLFAFKLEWSEIDQILMEKKIRPWINKKIIEYIGEPEPTLVDFICSKVMAGSTPAGILDDVQMVLDEEAEVFVVKMWRLLIYEVEAKKLGTK